MSIIMLLWEEVEALALCFKGKANRIKLYIQSCDFHSNLAVWGGGALLEFQDNASNNTVVFENNSLCKQYNVIMIRAIIRELEGVASGSCLLDMTV